MATDVRVIDQWSKRTKYTQTWQTALVYASYAADGVRLESLTVEQLCWHQSQMCAMRRGMLPTVLPLYSVDRVPAWLARRLARVTWPQCVDITEVRRTRACLDALAAICFRAVSKRYDPPWWASCRHAAIAVVGDACDRRTDVWYEANDTVCLRWHAPWHTWWNERRGRDSAALSTASVLLSLITWTCFLN